MNIQTPRAPRAVRTTLLQIAVLCALTCGGVAPVVHAQEKPASATATAKRTALLSEISRVLKTRNLSSVQVDRIVANLSQLDMAELEALAGFAPGAATGADRLVPGSAGSVRDRAGELTGRLGTTNGSGTSASQRGVERALTPGIRDGRGQASTCQACPESGDTPINPFVAGGTSNKGIPDSEGNVQTWPKKVDGQNGSKIEIWQDGSASITTGKRTEYVSSDQRLVDKSGNAKEPAPDSEQGSGRVTAGDLKRIGAIINRHRQPTGDEGGSGGPVDTGRTDPTGSRGLYTESRLGAGYVSESDLKEIVRLSIEKLRGPQGR